MIAVVGGGSWGTAFSVLAAARSDVRLVCRTRAQADAMVRERRNPRYLTDVALPPPVAPTALDDAAALDGAELVVLATPSRTAHDTAGWVRERIPPGVGILSLVKGLDPRSGGPLSEVWRREIPAAGPICVLAGPNHAEEVAAGLPTATVVAGDAALAERVQALLSGGRFRVYVNEDLAGVELAGAAKNVIALAAGMSDGVGFGDNAKASLITRGLAEMTRLGEAAGARASTFRGLAGMGDLVATCTSGHSRNRRAGELIARGVPVAEVEARLGQVAEGLTTTRSLLGLAGRLRVELPICAEVERAAFRGVPVTECLASLMSRAPAAEE